MSNNNNFLVMCVLAVVAMAGFRAWQERPQTHTRTFADVSAEEKAKATSKRERLNRYYAREVRIASAANNHFYTDARVNGARLSFLIDTGASFVALRESDARRAGIYLSTDDFTVPISTANGQAKAARISLDDISVEGLSFPGIDALVMPDDKLKVNLLGMSYLSKLTSFGTQGTDLVLKG
ncbi:MAG: TIGR02281 family clan AA aspartic protease [Pseudomonadota bacterium]